MNMYKADVREMVEKGNADKGRKLSDAQIQEKLKAMYSGRFDIPSTRGITSYVSTVVHQQSLGQNGVSQTGSTTARVRHTMSLRCAQTMEGIVRADQNSLHRGNVNGGRGCG